MYECDFGVSSCYFSLFYRFSFHLLLLKKNFRIHSSSNRKVKDIIGIIIL